MLSLDFDAQKLSNLLGSVEAVSLQGLALMQCPSLLADREAVRTATLELIAYNTACAKAIARLQDVPPIPLTAFVNLEWAL